MGTSTKPAGLIIGLLGCLAFGWGLYNLMEIGSCGDVTTGACPPGSWKYFVALPVGILTAVGAIFAGGGGIVFMGIFATVGISSILSALVGDAEDEVFAYVFGGLFLLSAVAPLALIPLTTRKMKRAQQLLETGREGVGTVLSVQDTGVTINDNPRVKLRFRIEPTDRSPAFDAEKAVTVSRVAVPRVGDRFPVWFDPEDRSRWAFGTDIDPATAPPKVRALFAKAAQRPQPMLAPPAPTAAAPDDDPYEKIAKLNDLRMKGAITDEEFQATKDRILKSL